MANDMPVALVTAAAGAGIGAAVCAASLPMVSTLW